MANARSAVVVSVDMSANPTYSDAMSGTFDSTSIGFAVHNASGANVVVTLQGSLDGGTRWVDLDLLTGIVANNGEAVGRSSAGTPADYTVPALWRTYRFKCEGAGTGIVTIDFIGLWS